MPTTEQTITPRSRLAEVTTAILNLESVITDLNGAAAAMIDLTESGEPGPNFVAGEIYGRVQRLKAEWNSLLDLARSYDPAAVEAQNRLAALMRANGKGEPSVVPLHPAEEGGAA